MSGTGKTVYDLNECRFSGKIIDLKRVDTKTDTSMASIKIQCFREQIRNVAFKEIAEVLLGNFDTGSRIEFSGRLQTSNWERNGTKYFSFQINISEIEGHRIPKRPRVGLENVDYAGGPF
jgi:single-stranded DNA-binding protein